jgi:hypothetical protein
MTMTLNDDSPRPVLWWLSYFQLCQGRAVQDHHLLWSSWAQLSWATKTSPLLHSTYPPGFLNRPRKLASAPVLHPNGRSNQTVKRPLVGIQWTTFPLRTNARLARKVCRHGCTQPPRRSSRNGPQETLYCQCQFIAAVHDCESER